MNRTQDTADLQPEAAGKEPVRELILLPDNTKVFTANGRAYLVQDSFSNYRFTQWEAQQIEFTFTGGIKTIFGHSMQIAQALAKGNLYDAAIANDRILNGLAKSDEKVSFALQMATLFVNREDEDPRYWNSGLAAAKIQDWNEQGLDTRFFLRLAVNSVPGFLDVYKSFIQTSSPNPDLNQTDQPLPPSDPKP